MFNFFSSGKKPNGPDFSFVDSLAKAVELYRKGVLEKLHLMPLEYGGEDIPDNTLYVPVGLGAHKRDLDISIIGPLVEFGETINYKAIPEYQGNSFVPIAIRIEMANFISDICIWGDALNRTGPQQKV